MTNKFIILLSILLILSSCDIVNTGIDNTTYYVYPDAYYELPTDLYDIPSDPMNKITQAKVDAGEVFFKEKGLSLSGTVSCESCHNPNDRFQTWDKKFIGGCGEGCYLNEGGKYELAKGYAAKVDSMTWVNSRGATNIAYQSIAGLSGRFGGTTDTTWRKARINHFDLSNKPSKFLDSLFQCEPSLFQANIAMGGHRQFATQRLFDKPELVELLNTTFDTKITKETDPDEIIFMISCCLDAFQRAQITNNNRFQRWLKGEVEFTEHELAGYALVKSNCTTCHDSKVFSGDIAPSHLPNLPGVPDAVNDIRNVPDSNYVYRVVRPMLGGMNHYGSHSEYDNSQDYLNHHVPFEMKVIGYEPLNAIEISKINHFVNTL